MFSSPAAEEIPSEGFGQLSSSFGLRGHFDSAPFKERERGQCGGASSGLVWFAFAKMFLVLLTDA